MKVKKNKNGFTLIELLITIAIITAVLGIASIIVIILINNSKEKSISIAKNNILNAARIYTEEYANEIYWQTNTDIDKIPEKEKFSCVSINELTNKNLLKKETIEKLPNNHKYIVIWKSQNNSISSEEFDNINSNKCKYSEDKLLPIPVCENVYYNGKEQQLIKYSNTYGVTLENYKATNIGTYQITAKLNSGYKWNDTSNTNITQTITCSILAPQYKIKYNANGGTGTMENSNHTYDEEKNLTKNSFIYTGHKFKNWNTKEDGTGTTYENEQSILNLTIKNEETINLYAQWIPNKVYINFNTNGGTVTTTTNGGTWTTNNDLIYLNNNLFTQSLVYGSTINSNGLANYNNNTYLNINKTGHHAIDNQEWKCLSGCTTSEKTFDQDLTTYSANDFCDASNENCTVVVGVNWIPDTYTITYNANGGTNAPSFQTKTYEIPLTLSSEIPTNPGQTFQGWGISATDTSVDYNTGATYTNNSNITLYAIWKSDTLTINDTRYSCQKYNNESFYRLSTFYITTCSNGNCTFNKLNGLTSSNSNASLSIITPPESTVAQNTLETSIPSNCAGTTYYITATGLNCRNIPTTSGSTVIKTISQCSTVTIVPTTTKYETSNSWYYNPNLNCYLAEGTGNSKYISTTKPSSCSSGSTTTPAPEEDTSGATGCSDPLLPFPYKNGDRTYCCNKKINDASDLYLTDTRCIVGLT